LPGHSRDPRDAFRHHREIVLNLSEEFSTPETLTPDKFGRSSKPVECTQEFVAHPYLKSLNRKLRRRCWR
jgi:hypothetical protein